MLGSFRFIVRISFLGVEYFWCMYVIGFSMVDVVMIACGESGM